jgi:hypothetical protein
MKAFLKEEKSRKRYEEAEEAKRKLDFKTSLALYKSLHEQYPEEEVFTQRLALMTYKAEEPGNIDALKKASEILEVLQPLQSFKLEVIALSGAINKRLYEEIQELEYLDKSLWFYKRGFSIHKDYYTGVNIAYLYAMKSLSKADVFDAFADYGIANSMWKKVVQACEGIIADKNFIHREDKEWIFQSLSQAYMGLEKMDKVINLLPLIRENSKGRFDLETFRMQNCKLIRVVDSFKVKYLSSQYI